MAAVFTSSSGFASFGGASSEPMSRVELHLSCMDLPNKDTFSKSDPVAVVYISSGSKWVEYARTETIQDNLNPTWVTPIVLDYFFEATQHIRVLVYDVDDASGILQNQDFLGGFETTLAAIMGGRGRSVTGKMKDERGVFMKSAKMTIAGEELEDMKMELRLSLSGKNLDKKDMFGKSDPYFEICRAMPGATSRDYASSSLWVPVFRSKVVKKTLNPDFELIALPLSKITGGNMERRILIRVWDWNKNSSPDLIGLVELTALQLTHASSAPLELINPKKKAKKKKYRNSGILITNSVELVPKPSFLDYIVGGCEINLVVAIDFTASNGPPAKPQSLHYMSPYEPNHYVRAITSIGEVLSNYDSDQRFPCFGYGGMLPGTNSVSHCFPLNGNPSDPSVHGVDGIIAAYHQAIQNVSLYGPTHFADCINVAAAEASKHVSQDSQAYTLLLIITDGIITDIDATTAAIVAASALPLSIVIVGVGSADFSAMEVLDGDDVRLSHRGVYAERDIVQFVPFRDFTNSHPEALARETLAEIPEQFISYMQKHQITPNPPLVGGGFSNGVAGPSSTGIRGASFGGASSGSHAPPPQPPSEAPPAYTPVDQGHTGPHPSIYDF